MWLTILLALVASLGAALGGIAAVYQYRENHSDRSTRKQHEMINHALHPYDIRILTLEQNDLHSANAIEAAITRALQPVIVQLTDFGTKMDVLWELQKQAALDAARILHHPEPGRAEIDHLLDAFVEDTLTPEEEIQLRKFLVIIREWEPGDDVGFPVYQGEQMAAAILLRTMKHIPMTDRAQQSEETPGDGK